jgi:ERCC4-related helicase
MKKGDTKRIMREFYHPVLPSAAQDELPDILGLSASPITNAKPGALEELESNLNAICKAPTRHLVELQQYVHRPEMCRLTYDETILPPSKQLQKLQQVIDDFDLSEDPYVKYLQKDPSPFSRKQLQKIALSRSTNTRKELKSLLRRAEELHQQIGEWASTYFLNVCVEKVREKVLRYQEMVVSLEVEEEVFLYQLLSRIMGEPITLPYPEVRDRSLSEKARTLMKYLNEEYEEELTGIIFVKERGTAAILAHLISNHPLTHTNYSAKPFVGTSNFARKKTLVDLGDIKTQNEALADFRSRKNNLLVCTSVMEEGVDVSTMNLVIRFDEPQNFRAFIQSRGRARMVESKFVLMCDENDPASTYQKWKRLEEEMKAKYMDDMRQIAQRVEEEDEEEAYEEVLREESTG